MQLRCITVGYPPENCYLLLCGQGQAVLVDPGAQADRLYEAVRQSGHTLSWILLTHGHYDHIGAVQRLRELTGARLAVPRDERTLLADAQQNLSAYTMPAPLCITDADLYLGDGDTLEVGDTVLQTLHTPGHTEGSSCYLCGDVLFAGDTLFYGSIGRTDFPGGNVQKMLASLQRLATLPPETAVYPGHGEATTVGQEVACNPYMNGRILL